MNKGFYTKLAWNNFKANRLITLPFLLSTSFMVGVFYIMMALSQDASIRELSMSVVQILLFGTIIVGLFGAIFTFYTYNFLAKKRMKELGLYTVLGMNKSQIARLLFVEMMYIAFATLVIGIGSGVLLSKLLQLILIKMTGLSLVYGFSISLIAVCVTVGWFILVYALLGLSMMIRVIRLNVISLLKEASRAEKEPKANIVFVLLGVGCIGYGYYSALTISHPLKAILDFFFAVIAVIIGTYLLFMVVSIFVLKVLKRNKAFYYQTKNFISISGMLYRMKRNAVSLANICILATMLLVTMGVTVCLFAGTEDAVRKQMPREFAVLNYGVEKGSELKTEQRVKEMLSTYGVEAKNEAGVEYIAATGLETESGAIEWVNPKEVGTDITSSAVIVMITQSNYESLTGKPITLQANEIAFKAVLHGEQPKERSVFNVGKDAFVIKEEMDGKIEELFLISNLVNTYFIVVQDDRFLPFLESLNKQLADVGGQDISIHSGYYFDLSSTQQEKEIKQRLEDSGLGDVSIRSEVRAAVFEMNASFLFIGMFISLVFLIAQVVVMYYKQISEGYEDESKYRIMQRIGLKQQEIRRSINGQMVVTFFAPLIIAGIHVSVAYSYMTSILLLFGLNNQTLFMMTMVGVFVVFSIFYFAIYKLTSRVYYKIIKEK